MPRYDTEIISELYNRNVKVLSVVVEDREPDIRTFETDIDLANGDQVGVTVTFEAQWFEAHWEEWAQRRILVEPAHWEAKIKSVVTSDGQPLDSSLLSKGAYQGLETQLDEFLNHH